MNPKFTDFGEHNIPSSDLVSAELARNSERPTSLFSGDGGGGVSGCGGGSCSKLSMTGLFVAGNGSLAVFGGGGGGVIGCGGGS